MNILLHFNCGTKDCGWQEDIGVDIHTGLVIEGSITFVCPRCGSITVAKNIIAALPVRFLPRTHK